MDQQKNIIEKYPPPDKTKTPSISQQFKRFRTLKTITVETDPFIQSQLELVSRQNISNWIERLSSFHNRHTKSPNIYDVGNWLKNELSNLGYTDNENIKIHLYQEEEFTLENVICTKTGDSRKILLICAHYDTILKNDFEDIVSRAPGADDNASGVAAILEIARILFPLQTKYDIQFVFFSGEEQGLWGSKHYANYLKINDVDIHLLINLDMCGETGYLSTNNTTNIDVDNGQTGVESSNNEASQLFGLTMEQMAKIYTDLDVEFDPIDASDYMPFEARGYVCIGAYDGSAISSNPHYHSSSDIPANLNMDFLISVTKMVLATILKEAKK
ncbi:MAG: M28 family metallopeptidase [Nitrososphaeraceae archaeon]|nr:M28 family metallopeptidase [Nitrososphaeraceae archaeon]